MFIVGYVAAIFIGVSLGLIGGGGSILTVPVLVYLFRIDVVLATSYSLFIVGSTSVIGSLSYLKKGLVNFKMAFVFGIPSIVSVFITRKLIVPNIPTVVYTIADYNITKSMLLLLIFAVLMIIASYGMVFKEIKKSEKDDIQKVFNYPMILLQGTLEGFLTGLVGAGGGFLIIPALVMLSKLPMKEAIGTSLVIIATKSLIGFMGESSSELIDWTFLAKITLFAIGGIFIGSALSKKIEGSKLKPMFGWFVLTMGIYILFKEILFK